MGRRQICHIGGVASLLCSEPGRAWITGQTIYADGGASLMDTVFPLQIQGAPVPADEPFCRGERPMLKTRFTELVGCSVPIQQAGMGAVAPPELAAAVSEAGGLGMLGTARPGGHTLKGLRSLLDRLSALTSRPFGVNFIVTRQVWRSRGRLVRAGGTHGTGGRVLLRLARPRTGRPRPPGRRAGLLAGRLMRGSSGRRRAPAAT